MTTTPFQAGLGNVKKQLSDAEKAAERASKTKYEKKAIIQNITLTAKSIARETRYVSSDPSRKIIILEKDSDIVPEEGMIYDVKVIHDSHPDDTTTGKLIVRIVAVDGIPVKETNKPEYKENPSPIEISEDTIMIMESQINTGEGGPLVPDMENFKHFCLDERTLRVIEKLAESVELRLPTLLEGPTAASKTSAIEYLAMRANYQVERLNLNGQSDTSELIGKHAPSGGKLQLEFEKVLADQSSYKPETLAIVSAAKKAGRGLNLAESQQVAKLQGMEIPEWVWVDGILPRAMKQGSWVILDEINLAEAQILERMNPVLERNPSIVISEHEGEKIGGNAEPVNEDFRIFATMNPAEYAGRSPMSPAYKDRWQGYMYVEAPSEKDYEAMLNFWIYGKQPSIKRGDTTFQEEDVEPLLPKLNEVPNFKTFIVAFAKFQSQLEQYAVDVIGKGSKEKYTFTRRGILSLFEYIENKQILNRKTGKRKGVDEDPKEIILRGIQFFYLDRLRNADDRKHVEDLLVAIGISRTETKWLLKLE